MLGLYQLSVIGPIALGSLAAGAVAQLIGIRWSLALCAALLGGWGLWSLTHLVPEIDAPAPSAGPERAAEAPAPRGAPAAAARRR
jgi:predicted acyltransferase